MPSSDDTLDRFMRQQADRIKRELADKPAYPHGTRRAVDPDDLMMRIAYTRRETIGTE